MHPCNCGGTDVPDNQTYCYWCAPQATVSAQENDNEPGVCVACRTSENLLKHHLTETLILDVCGECKEDGTYLAWLTRELERADSHG